MISSGFVTLSAWWLQELPISSIRDLAQGWMFHQIAITRFNTRPLPGRSVISTVDRQLVLAPERLTFSFLAERTKQPGDDN
jgi:hypothetical protein